LLLARSSSVVGDLAKGGSFWDGIEGLLRDLRLGGGAALERVGEELQSMPEEEGKGGGGGEGGGRLAKMHTTGKNVMLEKKAATRQKWMAREDMWVGGWVVVVGRMA
jgi:hypothetical protein